MSSRTQTGVSTLKALTTGAKSSIGTTAVQLTTDDVPTLRGVLVKAASTNTGIVYVGPSTITNGTTDATDGFELVANQGITLEIDNANRIYVIGSAASQKVFWVVV